MKAKNRKVDNIKITEKILDFFRSGSPLTFSETMRQYYGLPVYKKHLSRKELYDKVEKLRRQGWLEKKWKQDQIYYTLTAKGKVKQLVCKLKNDTRQRADQGTLIIFDIPEEKRNFRSFLRRLLKQMKFTMIQKSAFITPYILPDDFYHLLREMDLMQYVKVIEGKIRYY